MNKHLKMLLFALCLLPITLDGLSINYSFVLLATLSAFWGLKIYRPNGWVSLAIIAFTLIYLFSFPFTLFLSRDESIRAFISFLIFMSIFSFSIVRIESEEIDGFRSALILFSCLMAWNSLAIYLIFGNGTEGEDMKNIVGSQRIGFIYIIGLFVLLYRNPPTLLLKFLKLGGIVLILAGIMLTYSRSSIIALAGATGLYAFVKTFQSRKVRVSDIRKAVSVAVAVSTAVVVLYLGFPSTFEFFGERILLRYGSYFASILPLGWLPDFASTLPEDIFIEEGSEGTRLVIWSAIIQHTLQNPVLGSGYLGSWVLKSVTTGSAHSQYMDVLLRVGFLGFAVWLVVIFNVFRFLLRRHPDLFWGGVGILIYGLFHETFKESQGAFILAFLIGMYANYARDHRRPTATASASSNLPSVPTMP